MNLLLNFGKKPKIKNQASNINPDEMRNFIDHSPGAGRVFKLNSFVKLCQPHPAQYLAMFFRTSDHAPDERYF